MLLVLGPILIFSLSSFPRDIVGHMKLLGVTECKDGEPVATGKLERCRLCLLPDFSFLTGNSDAPHPRITEYPTRARTLSFY